MLYLNEQIQKEELRDIWLAKYTELSLDEFINQNLISNRPKEQPKAKDDDLMSWAEMILANDTKGETDGTI